MIRTTKYCQSPGSLADADVRNARKLQLIEPHIKPLKRYVASLRKKLGTGFFVPDFDPCDAGSNAQCLLLLESPGRQARDSGFVSMNNPDPTARNLFSFISSVDFPRTEIAIWNAVPWYVGDDKRLGNITAEDVQKAAVEIPKLINCFPKLKVVVFVGRKSLNLLNYVSASSPWLMTLECPHPSGRHLNASVIAREKIKETLKTAKKFLRL